MKKSFPSNSISWTSMPSCLTNYSFSHFTKFQPPLIFLLKIYRFLHYLWNLSFFHSKKYQYLDFLWIFSPHQHLYLDIAQLSTEQILLLPYQINLEYLVIYHYNVPSHNEFFHQL